MKFKSGAIFLPRHMSNKSNSKTVVISDMFILRLLCIVRMRVTANPCLFHCYSLKYDEMPKGFANTCLLIFLESNSGGTQTMNMYSPNLKPVGPKSYLHGVHSRGEDNLYL